MKPTSSLLLLAALVLSACTPAATLAPTPTASNTLPPTKTPTTEATATNTPVVIPDYMQEYQDRGFDTLSGNGVVYFVIDETKTHYAPEQGVIYQERVIRDWFEVTYIENGTLKHGFVIDFMGRGGNGVHNQLARFVGSIAGASEEGFIPTNAFVKAIHAKWDTMTKGDYPIAKGLLGVQPDDTNGEILYGDIFPAGATTIYIPGIGDVLTVTQLTYVDPPVKSTPTP